MKSHAFPVLIYLVRHLFSSMIIEKFTQDCLWLSVATRHPWNQFTRVQRLTCYMTLLLCNMVINVMFWKVNSTTTKRDEQAQGEPWRGLFVACSPSATLPSFQVRNGVTRGLHFSSAALPLEYSSNSTLKWEYSFTLTLEYTFSHWSHSLTKEMALETLQDLDCRNNLLSLDNHSQLVNKYLNCRT